jgi:DNA-binding transcriptional ArsR family regulator
MVMSRSIDTRRHRAALPVFTPSAVSPESLALRTVGREAEIERLVRAIRTAATTENRPHQLIVGPRGSGKSHLLIVALHEAVADKEIAERVAVALLPEDAVEIAGYEDLLVSIIDRVPAATDEHRDEARDARVRHDLVGLERIVLEQIGGRVLILIVENLDRVFGDLGEQGQARLRSLTETSGKLLVLASTPLLFDGVSDHARPWYGSFDVEHLRELDAEQGCELLQRIAVAAGDDHLAASLDTPTGLSRVKAVERLAGGSPRMWTVLAGCITIELLDELVPLVEALFDELAPYYQQRLWELAGAERKLVYELCRVRSVPVKELAHATGLSQRAAATSLGRLENAHWVRREKRVGTDRRTTWYSLREPLLRHHVEYRETRGRQLPAIVGFLRDWYEVEELAAHLAKVSPASLAETYVLAALSGPDKPGWRGAWPLIDSQHDLIAAARCWMTVCPGDGLASVVTGVIAEAIGIAAIDGAVAARNAASARTAGDDRRVTDPLLQAVEMGVGAVGECPSDPLEACRRGLAAASEAGRIEDRDRIALGLLAGSLGTKGPRLQWFDDHAAIAEGLPADEQRLRLIFASVRAVAEPLGDPVQTIVRATDAVATCWEVLGARDLTTQRLVLQSVCLSPYASDVAAQERLAATVVALMTDASTEDELTMLLLVVRLMLTDDLFDPWVGVWSRATQEMDRLGPIHRYIRSLSADESPDFENLSSTARAYLGPMIRHVAARLANKERTVDETRADV